METVLGIDVGTQSSKVLFYDFHNRRIAASASAPHEIISGDDGTSEQEAAWWIEAIQKALGEIPREIRRSARSVGVSGQQHGFVPLDASGKVLHRVKLWNDTSTVEECRWLTEGFGGNGRLIREAGNPILPGYTASKILWFKKNHPEKFARMVQVLLPHDYINFFLTGRGTMEYGDASGTGLMNIKTRRWNEELAALIDPALLEKLPPLGGPETGAGTVSPGAAAFFDLPGGIPVSCGGGDNMMAAIGTGTVKEGVLTMSLGTSGTLFGYSSSPVIDPEGSIAAFCSSTGGWLPLLCTMNCTVATEQTRTLFDVEIGELDGIVEKVPPGSKGVVVLPFFTGERIPNMPYARASIMGLNRDNTAAANILRASMEAAIYGMRLGLESLEKLGVKASRIILTGGGSQSAVWRQLAADITGLPMVLPQYHDAAALGAAVQALWYRDLCYPPEESPGGGIEDYAEDHVSNSNNDEVLPQRNRKAYTKGYSQYLGYLKKLKPLYT